MKGKDNNFKDVTVRRQNVADALQWLINNNPHYKDIIVNQDSLNSLPLHGVPQNLLSVETEKLENTETCEHDLGPQNEEDIVYNESTEMSSFLPIPECQQQEVQAIQQQLLCHQATHMRWPTVDNTPLRVTDSKYQESLDRFEKSKTLKLCLKNAFRELSSKMLFRFSKNSTPSRNSQKTKIHLFTSLNMQKISGKLTKFSVIALKQFTILEHGINLA